MRGAESQLVQRFLREPLNPVLGARTPVGSDVAQSHPYQLAAASSLGKCPRVLMILRSRALTLSNLARKELITVSTRVFKNAQLSMEDRLARTMLQTIT